MGPAGNKARHLSPVSHTTKAIPHLYHHRPSKANNPLIGYSIKEDDIVNIKKPHNFV